MKQDFCLPQGSYLLNHSVGRPLVSMQEAFNTGFMEPWQYGSTEPWQSWLYSIDSFTKALANLFGSKAELFCPQVNLSSALTKLLMSHPRLANRPKVLMSEIDFPSMGFALEQSVNADIEFIDKSLDITDIDVWRSHINSDVDLVFISHAYSNTGQVSPVADVVKHAKANDVLSIIDVAQSAGVMPLNLSEVEPDFLIGSSVKWLCGGPGAAYLWVSEQQLANCQPKDVGWFSHENPFEFDIHNFKQNDTTLKFWGGTPSVAPYVFASHSISYFNHFGVQQVHEHNRKLQALLVEAFANELVSPIEEAKRSGTVILNFNDNQSVLEKLKAQDIAVDLRSAGLRVSPHIYNDETDIEKFIRVVKK